MKSFFWKSLMAAGLLSLAASAQSANGSAAGNASVKPGQASAGANTNQSVQAPGASANVNASTQAQVSSGQDTQKEKEKGQSGTQTTAGASGNNSGSASAPGVDSSAALSAGTMLQAELTKPVDVRKTKPGDEVTAKVTQDVKADGRVVVRKGSQLVGHVTEAQARSNEHADSRLGIVFDKAILKGGQEMSFNGMVQALAPPVQATAAAATDESAMISGPAAVGGGGARSGGGGLVGGVASTATGTVSGATRSATGTTGGAANGTLSTAGGVAGGLTAQGNLTSASRGAIGLEGLTLNSATAGSAQSSVISSTSRNVKLDSGTQVLLQISGAAR